MLYIGIPEYSLYSIGYWHNLISIYNIDIHVTSGHIFSGKYGHIVQLLLSFSCFKSLFSFTKLYCILFRSVCFVLFRFVLFRLFSLKWHFCETRNFAKMLFIFAKLRNSFRFCFVKISRNEIPLKTLVNSFKILRVRHKCLGCNVQQRVDRGSMQWFNALWFILLKQTRC